MYSFKTDILGIKAEIEGVFDPGEKATFDCPGEEQRFEIESIIINEEELEIDCLNTETLEAISEAAFDAASDERGEY